MSQQVGDTYEEEMLGDSLPSCTQTDVLVSVSMVLDHNILSDVYITEMTSDVKKLLSESIEMLF